MQWPRISSNGCAPFLKWDCEFFHSASRVRQKWYALDLFRPEGEQQACWNLHERDVRHSRTYFWIYIVSHEGIWCERSTPFVFWLMVTALLAVHWQVFPPGAPHAVILNAWLYPTYLKVHALNAATGRHEHHSSAPVFFECCRQAPLKKQSSLSDPSFHAARIYAIPATMSMIELQYVAVDGLAFDYRWLVTWRPATSNNCVLLVPCIAP